MDQNLKDDTASAIEQLQEAESEAKALRMMTQRMILTHEEMVVFQSCNQIYDSISEDSLLTGIYFFVLRVGGGCFEEVLACSLLGLGCSAR